MKERDCQKWQSFSFVKNEKKFPPKSIDTQKEREYSKNVERNRTQKGNEMSKTFLGEYGKVMKAIENENKRKGNTDKR